MLNEYHHSGRIDIEIIIERILIATMFNDAQQKSLKKIFFGIQKIFCEPLFPQRFITYES